MTLTTYTVTYFRLLRQWRLYPTSMQETILRRLRGDLKRKNEMAGVKVRYEKSTAYSVSQVEVQEYSQYLLEDVEKIEAEFDAWDAQSSTEEDSGEDPTRISGDDRLETNLLNGENSAVHREDEEDDADEADEDVEDEQDDADEADEDVEDVEEVGDVEEEEEEVEEGNDGESP